MYSVSELKARIRKAWQPPKKMNLSEWADEYARLSAESSATEGRWRTLSYQRGIMDAMTDPAIEQINVMKSARVGFTKILNNLVGYHMHQDPCPIMVVQPTEADAEGYSKDEIAPMLRDTPVLKNLVSDAKAKDTSNTILNKYFPGGIVALVGANSPRGFRRVSRRIVLFDEVDGYPPSAGTEGDQIKLGIRRSEYYWNRKIVAGSTPTLKGFSRMERMFEETDKRRYFVPCPHCGEFQFLKWDRMKWPEGEPLKAYYQCDVCDEAISHDKKHDMLDAGEWRATATSTRPGLVGFHIWAAYSYSPNATWGQLALEFEQAQGNPESLKTFINTVLGETFEEKGAKVSDEMLAERVEDLSGDLLPEGVLVLVGGADVQIDRIEIEIVGFGLGEESWSIDYQVFYGDPNQPLVWQQLELYLSKTYVHPTGVVLMPARVFIDTGGASTTNVYAWVKDREGQGIYGIKGRGGDGLPAVGNPTKNNIGGINLFPLGTFTLKDTVMGRLKIAKHGAGYCHFGKHNTAEYFKQITAEEVRTRYVKGNPVREWHKTYKHNESLDCRCYATAALISLNVNLNQLHEIMNGTWNPTPVERGLRGEMSPELAN